MLWSYRLCKYLECKVACKIIWLIIYKINYLVNHLHSGPLRRCSGCHSPFYNYAILYSLFACWKKLFEVAIVLDLLLGKIGKSMKAVGFHDPFLKFLTRPSLSFSCILNIITFNIIVLWTSRVRYTPLWLLSCLTSRPAPLRAILSIPVCQVHHTRIPEPSLP